MTLLDFYQKFNDIARELTIDIDFNNLKQQYIIIDKEERSATNDEQEYISNHLDKIIYNKVYFITNAILIYIKPFNRLKLCI